jgi:hypothetical protein
MAEVGLRWCGINAASTERRILTELLSFPAGKHDDQVDALGLAGQLLDKISAGPPEAAGGDATRWLLRGVRANAGRQLEDDVRRTMTYAPLFSSLAEQRPRRGVMAQASTLDNVHIEGV